MPNRPEVGASARARRGTQPRADPRALSGWSGVCRNLLRLLPESGAAGPTVCSPFFIDLTHRAPSSQL